jgi:dipeptidyl aminopeptidase/acylaminoacyl peptidase
LYPLILVALGLAALGALAPVLIHRAYRAPRVREQGTPAALGLPFRTAHIPTANGKHLFAWLVSPTRVADQAPAVVVMHGWGGNAEQMLPFAALLHREGYAVLLFDARNHGGSDTDGHSSMPRFAEDLEHSLQWLTRQPGVDPGRLVLLGHSVGAGAALLTASRRHDLAAVVSIAAFAHPVELMRRQMRSRRIPHFPVGWLVLHYIERAIGARFDDIAPCNTIRRASCPVLLVHGEDDARIPPADALRIYANRHDDRTELMLLPHTGHESREAVQAYGGALTAFIRRSLPHSV